MKKFTEIEQFRNVIRGVKLHSDFKGYDADEQPIYRHESQYPILTFNGTIKCHGTNASCVLYKDGHMEYQSRERVLSITSDNAKFFLCMSLVDVKKLFEGIEFTDHVALYGEWCGGNIQKGMAITGLPNMWVLFALKIDDVYQDFSKYSHLKMEDKRIFNIYQFENYTMDIDFNYPEISQNKLVDLTLKVEEQCPVGRHFVESCDKAVIKKVNNTIISDKELSNLGNSKQQVLGFLNENIKEGEEVILNIKISE